ncbi:Acetyltransferase (GNAT) domain-containing protein [Marininema mesophilum]|uniref:Lysine N-acyltransferase MbtK n=1 Tax=Marininema mesophilum TaxID=1048340 RepID=A0A1H2S894_9BACL|nr:GNAT family N-acetyltransferase [Marininema mesophilum]SDW27867.1 Acetyltransferase (GNAT) domain-containing protein [Marininema mesophilum]
MEYRLEEQQDSHVIFQFDSPELNTTLTYRSFSYKEHLHTLHKWMCAPHISPFWKLKVSLEEFEEYLSKSLARPHRDHYIIFSGETPISYLMRYRVAHDIIRDYYDYEPTDIGGHIVIGDRSHIDPSTIVPIVRGIINYTLQTEPVNTFVVEPDSRNRIIVPALKEVGFKVHSRITMPHKRATLMICKREEFTQWQEITIYDSTKENGDGYRS